MNQQVDAKKLIASLAYHIGYYRSVIASNTYVLGSPWESDFLYVTNALYWHEFEIKVSRADFLADLKKRCPHAGITRHEFLASKESKKSGWYSRQEIPRPASFCFVAPGTVSASDVPSHADLINWSYDAERDRINLHHTKPSPRLATQKLTVGQLYSLARKIAWKNRSEVSA